MISSQAPIEKNMAKIIPSRYHLTRQNMDYIERGSLFETTPERFRDWLYRETLQQWPDKSIVSEFTSYPPEPFRVEDGIALGVELLPSGRTEPVTVQNAIRFWMLQTSESPNVTRIRTKCKTGVLQIDRDATIDFQKAADCFERLWATIYSEFRRAEVSGAHESLRSSEFDAAVRSVVEKLSQVKSEDDFISYVLKPMFEVMGYEGVTCLHHTGSPEYGKDIVFYEPDRLGGDTHYAVVACVGRIHADSSKTQVSGHYQKIRDQVKKCFLEPYEDHDRKGEFHIDKVIVACSANITPEAQQYLREWEKKARRHLIFWDAERIAGQKYRLRL
jgi:hypothetical protein